VIAQKFAYLPSAQRSKIWHSGSPHRPSNHTWQLFDNHFIGFCSV